MKIIVCLLAVVTIAKAIGFLDQLSEKFPPKEEKSTPIYLKKDIF